MKLSEILTKTIGRFIGPGPNKGKICFILGKDGSGDTLRVQFINGTQLARVPRDQLDDVEDIKPAKPLEAA